MSTQNRRRSWGSSSLAKRQASSSEDIGKVTAAVPHLAKKRPPLGNITNQRNGSHNGSMVPCATKIAKGKITRPSISNAGFSENILPASANRRQRTVIPWKATSLPRSDESITSIASASVESCIDVSPSRSDGNSVAMSSCDSFKSPEVEYIDSSDVPPVDSTDRKIFSNLYISELAEPTGNICDRDRLVEMETDDIIFNIDNNHKDTQLCATFACDIYKHLRASEARKRPAADFMETVQTDINASMRAILVDWLIEVAEEYRLVPDTLYLTVNYIDRYLSGNPMNRQRLQLLGVGCMMIASKYEEICAPHVEEFCYITDNSYFKEEVLQMESDVLNFLKFEMTVPTTKCFLRRFVRAAQGVNEVPSLQLEYLANYIAELSLLEYTMLSYAPSLIAASSVFLAKYILLPSKRPWNSTLQHYTLYLPSDLSECVKELHRLSYNNDTSTLPSVREKYSQHKYKYVAKKHCPPSIPPEFFLN